MEESKFLCKLYYDTAYVWVLPRPQNRTFGDFMIPLKFQHLQNPPRTPPGNEKKHQGAVFVAGEPQGFSENKNPTMACRELFLRECFCITGSSCMSLRCR